jgi:hypothetical protein
LHVHEFVTQLLNLLLALDSLLVAPTQPLSQNCILRLRLPQSRVQPPDFFPLHESALEQHWQGIF